MEIEIGCLCIVVFVWLFLLDTTPKYIFIDQGVFAEKQFNNGDFLLLYAGALYSGDETSTTVDTDYTYYFTFKRENYW